jgi:hypothetical protein
MKTSLTDSLFITLHLFQVILRLFPIEIKKKETLERFFKSNQSQELTPFNLPEVSKTVPKSFPTKIKKKEMLECFF